MGDCLFEVPTIQGDGVVIVFGCQVERNLFGILEIGTQTNAGGIRHSGFWIGSSLDILDLQGNST